MASLLLATTVGGYGVIHSNNIGTQSVSYATSAGSSDTATNSSQLNGLSKAQLWNNSGQAHVAYQSFDAIPDFGVWFMQNSSAGDTPQTGSQFYVQTQGLGDDYGYGATTGNYALMTAVARDHAVKYTYYRTLENGTWGSWKKSAAGYSDSAGSLTSMNISQFTNNSGYITSVGNITRLWAESHPNDYYVRANWTGSYWQLTSNHPSPVQVGYADNAGAVAWGNVSSKPSYIMYYQGFTLDANTMDTNSTGFTYSVNAPFTGPIARFSTGGQYDLWLGGSYSGGGNSFFLRTRNGDNNTLNAWREIITSGNIGSQSVSYATSAGSAPNGSNANSFYDVTPGDGNGLRFWSSDQYKISMGVGSLYQYGTVYDYSIKTQMDAGSPGRGFTWGRINIAPIASLNATSGNFQVAGTIANGSIWINNGANYNNYDENIRLFDAPNGVSVIAFSASGTGGSPRTSLLGFSDRLETRVIDTWEQRIYGGYVEARGSFRAPIFYDSDNTGYSWNPNTSSAHRFSTPNGYLDIGPMNGSWCHFQTDRPRFYFGNSVTIDGDLKRYSDSALYIHSANYNSYAPTLTGGGASGSWGISVTGSAGGVAWGNVSSKPAGWLDTTNLIQSREPNSILQSGFYESYLGSGNPTGTWFNYINVRHSNANNGHGYQIGMSYYDNNLWFRSYQGAIAATFQAWSRALGTNTDPYPSNMDQYVRTSDSVSFLGTTSPTILVNGHSDNTKGYRIHNTSGSSVSAMFTNSSNQLVIAAGAVDQINLNKKVLVNGVALGVNVSPSGTAGRIDASNDIVAYSSSDERLKQNITPIANALDKVKSLTGVEFDWKPEHKEAHGYEGHDTGIIAQQVQDVMPSAVRTNDTGFLAVRYEKLIGLLIEGMKEQQAQIDELKAKLDGLTK